MCVMSVALIIKRMTRNVLSITAETCDGKRYKSYRNKYNQINNQ